MEETATGSENEQIPEEGGEEETGVILPDEPTPDPAPETPAVPVTDPVPEEPAPAAPVEEEVDDPTVEAPVEEAPVVEEEPTEEELVEDDAKINADAEPVERTVTITGWKDSGTAESPVPGLNQKVTVTASASEGEAAFDETEGTIKIQDGKKLTLNVEAKAGYKLDSVAIGAGTTIRNGSNYSAVISADASVAITVSEPTYSLKFTTAEANVKIKLDDAVKADSDKAELATTETAAIKRGAEPKDLKFTITGLPDTGVAAGKKLHVSVKADGSAVADEITVTETKSTDNKVSYSCTIDKAEIAALRTGLKVIVKVEEGTSVAAKAHVDDEDNNDMVDIKFRAVKNADAPAGTEDSWETPGSSVANKTIVSTALAGETFRFQVKMKTEDAATYAIDKVEAKYTDTANAEKTVTATAKGSDDEYNFVMPANVNASGVSIVVTTKVDDTKTRALTFKLTGDEGSATAKITKIEVSKTESGTTTTTLYTGTSDVDGTSKAITKFPGIADVAATEIKADGGLKLAKACADGEVTGFEVAVDVVGDYQLQKATGETDPVTTRTLTYGKVGATPGTALADTLEIAAETETKTVATSTATFTVAKASGYTDANTPFVGDITVGGDAQAVTPATDPVSYKLKDNAKVVTLTVKTKEGYDLTKEKITNTKSVTGLVKSVKSAAPANGEVTWTVELFASKIASYTTDALDVTVDAAAKKVAVSINPKKDGSETLTGFTPVVMYKVGEAADANVTGDRDTLDYGGKLTATITPDTGVRLAKVSYKMGETVTEVELEPQSVGSSVDIAKLVIVKVTDDVVITVETEKDYELTDLKAVSVDITDPENPETTLDTVETDVYGIYQVSPSGEYAVGLKQGGTAVDLAAEKVTAVVKNASGAVVTMPKVVFTYNAQKYLKINLAGKNLGGQEITIDMMKDGAVVGTYRLQVAKEATYVRLKEGNKIRQDVDSVQTYTVETDGELSDISVSAVSAGTGAFQTNVTTDYDNNGNLEITLAPMASDDVVTITPGAEGAEATKTYKNVTFTLNAAGTSNVHQDITLEAEPVFDATKKPTVTPVLSGASDTSFYVDVEMESADPASGKLYYEVTATAKAKESEDADAKTFAAVAGSKLEQTVTLPLTEDTQSWGGKRRIKINVAKAGVDLGNGVGWNYDVTAKLVYKNGATTVESSAVSEAAATGTVDTYFASALKLVKNSKKKPASTLYTGQTFDTPQYIATPTFTDKKVNYKITEDILIDGVYVSEWTKANRMDVWIDDNGDLVVGSVATGKNNVGKHTITVIATADMTGQDNTDMSGAKHTMYATRATINVTVARGIEAITFQNFGSKLYKAAGKAATLNVASSNIFFNNDSTGKNQPPKSKKVTYQVVGAGSTLSDLKPAPAGITMKGTKVTVDKNFAIDPVKTHNNQFMIYAKAADYKENTVAQLSGTFTVTSEAISLDNLVLAKAQYGNDGTTLVGYKVLAVQADKKTRNAVSAAEADGAQIFVLGKPATVGTTYSLAKWVRLAPEAYGNFTYKGGKKNVWEVTSTGRLWTYAGGQKADITVTANDGKKASKKLLLDLGWTATDGKDLALKIWTTEDTTDINSYYTNFDVPVYTPNKVQPDKDIESKATGTPRYYVQVMQGAKNDGTSTSFPDYATWYVNCDLKVSGGKFVSKGTGYAYITATAEKTVITLTDKNVAKGQKAKVYKYTILNKGFDKTLNKTSVKVTSKPNNLWNYAKTSEQKLDLALMNGKDPVAKGKIAKIEVDWSARTDKNYYMYAKFNSMIDSGAGAGKEAFFTVGENGKTTLTFKKDYTSYGVDYTNLYVNSYKLKVTVGTGTGSSFKPESQAVNLTVKVNKNKKFTFKPTTSYTFNPVDGAIALTGKASVAKGEAVGVDFYNLQNANVNGKSNKFTRLFYIDTDAKTGMQYLKLNTNSVEVLKLMYDVKEASKEKADAELTAADFDTSKAARVPDLTKIDKKNLTGYISYYAEADKGWYNASASGTTKITIKIAKLPAAGKAAKASQKYTPAETQIKSGKANETTPVNIYINGVYVTVGLAMVDPGKKDEGSLIVEGDGVNDNGQIVVKAKTVLEAGKKYNANLLVVPKNSIYYATVKAAAAAAAAKTNAEGTTPETPAAPTTPAATRADLMKLYGIPVKVTVVGAEKPVYAEAPTYTPGGEGGGSGTTTEKTVAEAKEAIEAVAPAEWTTKVELNAAGDAIDTAKLDSAKAALVTQIRAKIGSDYSAIGIEVTSIVLQANSTTKATATVTLSKGSVTDTVTITIDAKAATTPTDTVTVELDKTTAEADISGGSEATVAFTAKVKVNGTEDATKTVTWSVSGNAKDGTKFADPSAGTLTVAGDETAESLTVTATYTDATNGNKTATATVTVKKTA